MKDPTKRTVIHEVRELKPYITLQIGCAVISLIVAFFVDYFPLAMGISAWVWILLYVLFFIYAFLICKLAYIVLSPFRVRISDMNNILISHGEPVRSKCGHVYFVNIFTKVIHYRNKLNSGKKVTYLFNTKDNYYEKIEKNNS